VPNMRESHAAIAYVERATVEAGGLALRYGGFYGPGTGLGPGGEQLAAVRKRQFPVVGDGGGVWSFVHIHDAATATIAALERGAPGVYNVVDDDPAPARDWLPVLAAAAGAKPPRHIPRWLARMVAGEALTTMMTEIRGASNAKAKRELGWTPAYPSWREGFAETLRGTSRAAA
jgi:2-alkyl-3-oxoalkanoate reductase